jgi:hypothetical protein
VRLAQKEGLENDGPGDDMFSAGRGGIGSYSAFALVSIKRRGPYRQDA